MESLSVTDLLNTAEEPRLDTFNKNISSTAMVNLDYNNGGSTKWMDIFEDTLPDLDTILRNPNRFIINEEEVVKIEQARRVTVESIKHLSQNTNLIQDIDKKTGDVKPSKILNVNKEESFETYENKFIYSLIQNMKFFLSRKEKSIMASMDAKNLKQVEYNGVSNVGKEKVDVSLKINSKLETKGQSSEELMERVKKIKEKITDLTYQTTYKDIERRHIQLVVSPIKKTNVILKNPHFQKAVLLWNFIQEHVSDKDDNKNIKKSYEDNAEIRKYLDETFLLNYLVTNNIEAGEKEQLNKEELKTKLAENMVSKMLNVDNNLTEDELKELVAKGYAKIKYRSVTNDAEIRKIFNEKMEAFVNKIEQIEY
jgi:DNA repair protein SbcC/Rad50